MAQNLIVNVTILKSTRVVSQQAFNIVCIFGASARIEAPTVYSDPSDMLVVNGGTFMSSDPEYVAAVSLMSQPITAPQFVVAPNTASAAQVDTFAVSTLVVSHQYKFTIGSTVISYTSAGSGDTQQSILAALLTAIGVAFPTNPPVTGSVGGSGSGALLTLTASTAGMGITYSAVDSDLTHALVTANHSIATDIATAQNVTPLAFYGVIVTSHAAADIIDVATYIETQLLVYVTATQDSAVLSNAGGNIMAVLMGLAFSRTMILYSGTANTQYADAAWMGYVLPTTPGSADWADKTLMGITADNLTGTQITNILGNRGNIYVLQGGNGCTLEGITPAGEFFDVTIFLDWVASNMKSNITAVVTDPLNLKIPYTNQGIGQIETAMRQVMQQGQDNGGFAAGWSVFGPDANSVAPADRANRVLNNIGFEAQLAGAINTINVTGYVSA